MLQKLVYAKKLHLPSRSAHVLQSVHMAKAFAHVGAEVSFFPGVRPKRAEQRTNGTGQTACSAHFRAEVEALGIDSAGLPPLTRPFCTRNKGLYGLFFRAQIVRQWLAESDALFYARDIKEAALLAWLSQMPRLAQVVRKQSAQQRTVVYEMHEVLSTAQGEGRSTHSLAATNGREKKIMQAIHGLVVVNPTLVNAVKELFGYTGPALVEPGGFDDTIFYPLPLFSEKHPWPQADDPVTLVYIGTVREGKGCEMLLEAMRLLPQRYRLLLLGSGPAADIARLEERKQIVPDGERRITLAGHVPQKMIREYCATAHISVLPQQSAFFFSPLKLNESLALGLPVVCTPQPMFAEHSSTVHMADDMTAEAFAAAITTVAGNAVYAGELREKGLVAAGSASWTQRAKRILEFSAGLRSAR